MRYREEILKARDRILTEHRGSEGRSEFLLRILSELWEEAFRLGGHYRITPPENEETDDT